MTFIVEANLDVEARWGGGALPGTVAKRVSLYGALVGVLALEAPSDIEVWTPAPIDPQRIARIVPPTNVPLPSRFRVGRPPRADLAWADETARAANDRRLVHTLGRALPGAFIATDVSDIVRMCVGGGPLPDSNPFVAKAPWTAAGRDRMRWTGALASDQRTYLERLIARQGAVVVEPWCDRLLDVGLCGRVDAGRGVDLEAPHGLITDARGGFVGIDLDPPALEPGEAVALREAARVAGEAIGDLGYIGPFAVDAFAYVVNGERRFHAMCEINARHTFGFVARALRRLVDCDRLMLAGTPPSGARLLITPGDDGVCAWVE